MGNFNALADRLAAQHSQDLVCLARDLAVYNDYIFVHVTGFLSFFRIVVA